MHLNGFLWADIEGLSLTPEDKEILSHPSISGVILFSRNYESIAQLQSLTHEIKSIAPHLIITVDQEGGRVQRFREGFTELPSMRYWAQQHTSYLQKHSVSAGEKEFNDTLSIMIKELRNVGIYSSLLPVLDIDYDRNHVIGHRSFGDKNSVIQLGEQMIDCFHRLKMPVTAKHFPGHGWASVDSHVALPIDERSFADIEKNDLQPFAALSQKCDAIMLAHVVYKTVDPNPVCFSRFWIQEILQKQLKFNGLVMSDDLSMQAVAKMGGYAERATRALEAGCDILLACNARAGVIDIVDHIKPQKNAKIAEKIAYYARFLC